MSQQIQTQPLRDDERIELMISRLVVPRLSNIEGQMQIFNQLLNQVANRQKEEQERIVKQLNTINKILNGDEKSEGLLAVVNNNKKWIEGEKKALWFVIGIVITQLLGTVFLLLQAASKIP